MNKLEFIKHINALRLQNKNNWYFWTGIVDNKQVQLKGYNTWLQIFNIDGIDNASNMDISVKEFKNVLSNI